MNKTIASLCVAAIAALGASAGSVSAAAPPVHGVGTYQVTNVDVHSTKKFGTVTVINQTLSITNEGVLSGPSTADIVCVIRATGNGACAGTENFTGTIGERTGTARFAVALTVSSTGVLRGAILSLSATGDLAGLHAFGTFQGTTSGTTTLDYSFG